MLEIWLLSVLLQDEIHLFCDSCHQMIPIIRGIPSQRRPRVIALERAATKGRLLSVHDKPTKPDSQPGNLNRDQCHRYFKHLRHFLHVCWTRFLYGGVFDEALFVHVRGDGWGKIYPIERTMFGKVNSTSTNTTGWNVVSENPSYETKVEVCEIKEVAERPGLNEEGGRCVISIILSPRWIRPTFDLSPICQSWPNALASRTRATYWMEILFPNPSPGPSVSSDGEMSVVSTQ